MREFRFVLSLSRIPQKENNQKPFKENDTNNFKNPNLNKIKWPKKVFEITNIYLKTLKVIWKYDSDGFSVI